MAVNKYGGIIMLNIVEVFFFAYDLYYFKNYKINLKMHIFERIMLLAAFNTALFADT
jgi:hypothetical protein